MNRKTYKNSPPYKMELFTELMNKIDAYEYTDDTELSKDCREKYHIWTDFDFVSLFMLLKYDYLKSTDFERDFEQLKIQLDFILNEKFSNTICQEDAFVPDQPLTVLHLVKPEFRQHSAHTPESSGKDCELCQKRGWVGEKPVNPNFCVEEF